MDSLAHQIKPLLLTLLLPPVPALLLIALGALLLWRQRRRSGAALVLLGLAGAWLMSCEGTAQWLNRHLLQAPPALDAQQAEAFHQRSRERHDVAVLVLGGGSRDYVPEYAGPSLGLITLERLRYGVWLSRRVEAPLGFTGGIGWTARSKIYTEAMVAERVAREEFRQPLRWSEGRSRDTRENAALSLPLLSAAGVRSILLVTHVQHMPRALQAFRDAAAREQSPIEVTPAPMGLVLDGMSSWEDWCPDEQGLMGVRYAVYEWLGSLAGH
ncbi:YdcF family protein [Pelomonas sp. KK5]|uniref:YdcF family protein n=1 Tax=Pelomonas sp. KK5 TaxID=1855730 RepID=UPI00097BE0AB|nr:YdcF family protein [Pelomonas sp. KK5]